MTRWRPRFGVEMLGQAVSALVPARLQLGQTPGRHAVSPAPGCLFLAGWFARPSACLHRWRGRRGDYRCSPLPLLLLAPLCLLVALLLLALLPPQLLTFFLACLPLLLRLPLFLPPVLLAPLPLFCL